MLRCLTHIKVSYYLLGRTGPGPALSSRGLSRFLTVKDRIIIITRGRVHARAPVINRARFKTRGRHYLNK